MVFRNWDCFSRLVRQRQTQWSNLWVCNRPCAALKATCHHSTRGTVRPKLKLSLFALYRPTRKYPADSKDFIGKKVLFFLLVTTVHRITFYSIYRDNCRKVVRNLEINAFSRQIFVFTSQSCPGFINYMYIRDRQMVPFYIWCRNNRPLCWIF